MAFNVAAMNDERGSSMPNDVDGRGRLIWDALPWGGMETISNDNLMILVSRPGDESLACGGLIARCCRRGRPPFVMILSDGTGSDPHSNALPPDRLASLHERESREASGLLGLDGDRLLMAGLFDGTIPRRDDTLFDAVVRGVIQVMWRTDCNIVCSPWPDGGDAAHQATHEIAAEVAARSGVGHLSYAASAAPTVPPRSAARAWRLDITDQAKAKRLAIDAHRTLRRADAGQGSPEFPAPGGIAAFEVLLAPGP